MKIEILTQDQGDASELENQLLGLGYENQIWNQIADFLLATESEEPYYLVADYLLIDQENRGFLGELLGSKNPPKGLIMVSDIPGFEDFLDGVATEYADSDIPFLFMEKPFQQAELGELLFRLGKGKEGQLLGALRLPKHGFHSKGSFGPILRAARENLGLDLEQVASIARKNGRSLQADELAAIEKDESGLTISAEDWFLLTHLLYVTPDCSTLGFEPWSHLIRVREALEGKTYAFPRNFDLRRKLVALAKRERTDENFRNIVNKLASS